jgi:probable addiction module antidote protein
MTITKTIPYDGSQFLTDPVDQVDALNDALDSGSAAVLAIALRDIAKARGMSEVAKKVGITRAGLYKALSGDGDPKLSTFIALLAALDIKLQAEPLKSVSEKGSESVRIRLGKAPDYKARGSTFRSSKLADGEVRKIAVVKRGASTKSGSKAAA